MRRRTPWVLTDSRRYGVPPPASAKPSSVAKALQDKTARRAFAAIPVPSVVSVPNLGFVGRQMLLELFHLRTHYQLAVPLGRILGEIVLMIIFGSVEML